MLAAGAVALGAVAPVFAGTATVSTGKQVAPVVVEEPASWWSSELAFGYDSKYMFRGVQISDKNGDPVDNLVWTDFSLSAYGFTLGAWFAEGVETDYNELDVYASYAYSLGPVDFEGGYIFYLFPKNDGDSTHELFISATTDALPYITPKIAYYYDLDLFDGSWLELSLSHSFTVVKDVISIDPYAAVSFDFGYNSDNNALNNAEIGVAVPLKLSENVTLSGYVKYSWALDAIDDFQSDEVWAGASVTFSF